MIETLVLRDAACSRPLLSKGGNGLTSPALTLRRRAAPSQGEGEGGAPELLSKVLKYPSESRFPGSRAGAFSEWVDALAVITSAAK